MTKTTRTQPLKFSGVVIDHSRLILALLCTVSLFAAGCAATAAVSEQWKGAPEKELLRKWGKPDRTLASPGGGNIHHFSETGFVTLPDRLAMGIQGGNQSSTLLYTTHIFWCEYRIEVGPKKKSWPLPPGATTAVPFHEMALASQTVNLVSCIVSIS